MSIPVVFACANEAVQLPSGQRIRVVPGQHWAADDPLVKARPELFTSDSRFGMLYTQPREEYDPTLYPPVYGIDSDDEFESASAIPGEKRDVKRRGRPPRAARPEPAEVVL